MNELIPGEKKLSFRDERRQITRNWSAPKLDWKANVVCESCNNEWMSEIECQHGKPALSDLIIGKSNVPIDASRARSIALFAFKTAVVFNHIARNREPFFERSVRHEFRKSLTIPTNVSMWLTKFAPRSWGAVNTTYHEGSPTSDTGLEIYVCTYAVEHLVIQIVCHRERGIWRVVIEDSFPTIPFWPNLSDGLIWPPTTSLQTVDDFRAFADRWRNVSVTF